MMQRLVTRVIFACSLAICLNGPAAAAPVYGQWLAEAYPADGPGAAALVVKDGEVVYRGASGMADLELGVPLAPDSVFRIGSITKQFTAAAILLLAERGELSLDDEITPGDDGRAREAVIYQGGRETRAARLD